MVADIAYDAVITAYPILRGPQFPVTGITFLQSGIGILNHHSFSTRSVGIHLHPLRLIFLESYTILKR